MSEVQERSNAVSAACLKLGSGKSVCVGQSGEFKNVFFLNEEGICYFNLKLSTEASMALISLLLNSGGGI